MKTATLQHYAASPRFTPRQIVRLTAADGGVDFCFGFLRQVAFQQIRLAAVFTTGRPEPHPHLLLILSGQDRPFVIRAAGIAFGEWGLPVADTEEQALRDFVALLARRHPGITVPDETARFTFEGGLEEIHPAALPSLATSLRVMVDPQLGEGIQRLAIAPKPPAPAVQSSRQGTGSGKSTTGERTADADSAVDRVDLPWQRRLTIGPDQAAPPPPLMPAFGPALRYGPWRRGELLKGFRDAAPEVEMSRLERWLLPVFAAGMALLPVLYLTAILGLSYTMYHFASTEGQALVEGAVEDTWESGSFSFVLVILLCLYLIFALLSPLFTRQPRERHRVALQRGQELVLFGFVDFLAKVMDTPVPQRIEVVQDPEVSLFHRQTDAQSKELVLILGLPLAAGLRLAEWVGLLSRELATYSYRPGGDLLHWILRQHRRGERILADYLVYQESLGHRLDSRVEGGEVGVLTAIGGFLAFVFLSSTRWVVTAFVKLSEWISHTPRRWARRDADRFHRQMVGNTVAASALGKQKAMRQAYAELLETLETLDGAKKDDSTVLLDHLPAQLALASTPLTTAAKTTDPLATDPQELHGPQRPFGSLGLFKSSLPSTVLFRDFAGLSQRATVDFYRSLGVRGVHLEPAEEYLGNLCHPAIAGETLYRYFGGTINSRRPVPVAATLDAKGRTSTELLTVLGQQRQTFQRNLDAYWATVEDFDVIVDCRLGAREAFKLAEVDFEHQGMGVGEWKLMEQDAVARMQEVSGKLEAFEKQAGQRLMSALLLLTDGQWASRPAAAEVWLRRAPQLLSVVAEVNNNFRSLLELRDRHAVLATLRHIESREEENKRLLLELFEREIDTLYPPILALYKGLGSTRDPFHIDGLDIGLMVRGVANDYYALAGDVLRRIYAMYFRSLTELAIIAEQLEVAAGFEPLPDRGPFPEARPWQD